MGNAVHDVLTGLTSVYVGGPVLLLLTSLLLGRELLLVWPEDRPPSLWGQRLERAARVLVRPLTVLVGLLLLIKVLL